MAVEMDVMSDTGIKVVKAYFKIDEYSCSKNNKILARIRAYVSKDLEEKGNSPIEGSEHIIELYGDYADGAINTKKQIYEHMKTMDKYADAVDVLE